MEHGRVKVESRVKCNEKLGGVGWSVIWSRKE